MWSRGAQNILEGRFLISGERDYKICPLKGA